MTLDNEDQRRLLLELIAAANIPGKAIDVIYALQQAIRDARIGG